MANKFPIFLTFKAIDGATKDVRRINQSLKKQTQSIRILNNKLKR